MGHIDGQALNRAITTANEQLAGGLIALDVWDRVTGLSLAGYNARPVATVLLSQITGAFDRCLAGSSFPTLGRFWLANLDDGQTLTLLRHANDYMTGLLVKPASIGHLLNVVLPGLRHRLDAALGLHHDTSETDGSGIVSAPSGLATQPAG